MARTEEELYDVYLGLCLEGRAETPDAFCAAHEGVGPDLRARLETLYRLHAQAPAGGPEAPPFERLGEFRLLRRLDAGGMGTVYLAEQESLGRRVALKVIRSELRDSDTAAERFRREALAAARLKHPNVVQVFAAGEEHGVRYFAMELVEGRNLDEVLAAEGRLAWRTAARWARDLAHALQHAHAQGIVHRDVKPGNIRVTPDGRPRLFDFGIARDVEAGAGLTQTYAGSPLYSAPEQLMGRDVDGRTDVYALGIVLYELLTGRGPFAGGSMEQVLRRCLAEEPLAPRRLDPSLPRDLETVVLQAIAKEPRARYDSAAALAADLDAVLADRPIRARPPGRARRAARWLRRRPAVAVGLAAVVAVAALLGFLAWRDRQDRVRDARGLVVLADGLVLDLETARRRSRDLEKDVMDLRTQVGTRFLDDDDEGRLREGEAEVDRLRRAREEKFHAALALLRRAERLDADVAGTRTVRARLYHGRAREARLARDPLTEKFWVELAAAEDPDAPYALPKRTVEFRTDPPGAEVLLWEYREQAELAPDGERRLVPVPPSGEAPVPPGTWALRVRGRDWLVVEVAGHPVRRSVLVLEGGDVARGDRLLAIDDRDVRSMADVLETGEDAPRRFRFAAAGVVEGRSLDALGVVVGTPAELAARGGVEAKVVRAGQVESTMLPEGLDVRTTAAPAFLAPSCRVGVTPLDLDLVAGSYLAVLRHPERAEVRLAFRPKKELGVVTLPDPDAVPRGFVHVHTVAGSFLVMEREVTCGEYLMFLNDPDTRARIAAADGPVLFPRAAHNTDAGGFWPSDASGRRALPADWRRDWPVLAVDFDDAQAFVAWKNRAAPDGWVYALPTYEEWIGAGSGTTGRSYPFGNVFWPKWTNSNHSRGQPRIEPVLSYPTDESPLGVYDMAGGVHEWLDSPYGIDPAHRRIGGGAWGEAKPEHFRIENGLGQRADSASTQTGFRLVLRRRP